MFLKIAFMNMDYSIVKKQDLKRFIFQMIGYFAMFQLSGNIYLSGFAIFIGATDTIVTLLASLPIWSNLIQIFSPFFYEKYERRKKLVLLFNLLTISFLNSVILIPLFFTGTVAGYILFIIIVFAFAFNSLLIPGINV